VPSPSNPLGAKGAGEAGTTGALPAVSNAVIDALRPLGIEHLDFPFSACRVWQAIATQARGAGYASSSSSPRRAP
jgi:carbon-monoxide dehydrogenase large subunit